MPQITKNTWVKRREVDLSTLYEDPYFDPSRRDRNYFKKAKMSMDPVSKGPGLLGQMGAQTATAPSTNAASQFQHQSSIVSQ